MTELWYYTRDGQAQDPVTKGELARLAGAGLLQPTDLVWTEGMPQWVRAASAEGLFAARPLSARPEAASYALAPDRADDLARRAEQRRRPNRPDNEQDRRRVERDQDDVDLEPDDDDYDRPSRRQRQRGLSGGAKAAIIASVLVSIGLVAVIVFLVVRGGESGNSRSFSLAAAQEVNGRWVISNQTFELPFKAGNKVEIWVKSTAASDVDLYVYDPNNRLVEFDDGDSSDCYVRFLAGKSQRYRIELRNEYRPDQPGRNGANSGTLTFQEGPAPAGEALVEYTNRRPWFMDPARQNRPGFPLINPGINPPGFGQPQFKGPNWQPPGFKGPNIRPKFNPGFPNKRP